MEHKRSRKRLTWKNSRRIPKKTHPRTTRTDTNKDRREDQRRCRNRNLHHDPQRSRRTMGRLDIRQVPPTRPHPNTHNIPPTRLERQRLQQKTHKNNRPNRKNTHHKNKIQKQQTNTRNKLRHRIENYLPLPFVRLGLRFLLRHLRHLVALGGLVAPQLLQTDFLIL